MANFPKVKQPTIKHPLTTSGWLSATSHPRSTTDRTEDLKNIKELLATLEVPILLVGAWWVSWQRWHTCIWIKNTVYIYTVDDLSMYRSIIMYNICKNVLRTYFICTYTGSSEFSWWEDDRYEMFLGVIFGRWVFGNKSFWKNIDAKTWSNLML